MDAETMKVLTSMQDSLHSMSISLDYIMYAIVGLVLYILAKEMFG